LKIEEKLKKLEQRAADKKRTAGMLNLALHQLLLPRNENFTETQTLSRVHKHFLNALGSGRPCPCEPALLVL